VLLGALKAEIMLPIPPRMAQVALTLCQPLLLRRLLSYLTRSDEHENPNIGYGLIGAYGVVYTGMAASISCFTANHVSHELTHLLHRLRMLCIGIYNIGS